MISGLIGKVSLVGLLVILVVNVAFNVLAIRTRQTTWQKLGRAANVAQFVLAAIASACLVILLISENLHYDYVAEYTGSNLPIIYRIAAFWGGNAGSLLLWTFVLTLYTSVVSFSRHDDDERMLPIVSLVMSLVTVFYVIVTNFCANPFSYSPVLHQANGLNPLLQNPGMTVHPINVYLGYIGFTVPFAYAIANLWLKKTDATWLRVSRRWTLVAWLFLSIGIVYGAHWSYDELGWGGYWAWDPVENASLLPWLTGTAFLHSAIVQEKRGMLKGWNVILVTLTFILTILGTFLTRSGVLWSIHAFANSVLGNYFFVFLIAVLASSALLISFRWKTLRADTQFEAMVSKETGFLLNNVLFLGSAFAVLWGTVFPIISEGVTGHKMMVAAPFYNSVNLPLAVCILILMGIGPALAWRKASIKHSMSTLVRPMVIAIVCGLAMTFLLQTAYHKTSILGSCAFISALYVLLTVLEEFYRAVVVRLQVTKERWVLGLLHLVAKNRRRYGGYIVHLAIALMAAGIAGSGAFHVDLEQQLSPGSSAQIGNYRITFEGMGVENDGVNRKMYANLKVDEGTKTLGVMRPAAEFYPNGQEPSTDVSIFSQPLRDLYVVMLGTANQNQAVFDFHVNPLVQFIWYGGYLFIAGTVLSLWPERRRKEASITHDVIATLYHGLAELEYDYRMGKIDHVDYSRAKSEFVHKITNAELTNRDLEERLRREIQVEVFAKRHESAGDVI